MKELWDWCESSGTIKKEQQPTVQKPEGKSAMEVKNQPNSEKNNTTCVCKENQFYWGNKLTCDERKKVLQVCAYLWGEKNKVQKASELMSVMHLETDTTFDPSIDNGVEYTGLIQFSEASAKSLGTSRSALRKMSFIEQMDYVKRVF